jgi:hypothetical protein
LRNHAREDLLPIPVDLVIDGLRCQGALLNHCAMCLDTAGCTATASIEVDNMVHAGLMFEGVCRCSREDGRKAENLEESHRDLIECKLIRDGLVKA